MKYLCMILASSVLCLCTHAEMRTWTIKSGEQLEAEYKALQAGKVLVRNVNDKDRRIPLADLSEEDRLYVELVNPPLLSVDFIESFDQRDPRPSPIWVDNSPVRVFLYTFGARVKQKSAGKYRHELKVELYAISQQDYDRSKYHLLTRIESAAFVLNKKNGLEFEFRDDNEIQLMRYKLAGQYPRGERFAESLILVRDKRGEIVAYNSTKKWLYKNVDKISKLPVGAWFNDDCIRVHPTSPKDLLAD